MKQDHLTILLAYFALLLSGCSGKEATEGIAAWATLAATVIALVAIINSNRQLKDQIRVQNEFERKRIESNYLAQALYTVRSGMKEAQVFISAWTHYQAQRKSRTEEETEDEKAIRREFAVAWRKFDDDLAAALDVFRAVESESDLVTALQEAYDSSTNLFELLMNKADLFGSEEAMMATNEARQVEQTTDRAAKLLARRLSEVFRGAEPHGRADG
jgi:hypothetical protein